jgi:hypothetical protein
VRERGDRPVFVTDGHELEPFRRRKLLVDQVVDAEARLAAAPDLPWRLYRRRQYALMGAVGGRKRWPGSAGSRTTTVWRGCAAAEAAGFTPHARVSA